MAKASAAKREIAKKIWESIKEEINAPFIKNEESLTNKELFHLSTEDRLKRLDEIQHKRREFWASSIDDFWDNDNYYRSRTYSNSPYWLDSFSYDDRYGKGYQDLPLKDLFENMQEMISSTLTNSQLHLLGCFISIIAPLMRQARKTATAEVVANNKYQKELCHKYRSAVDEMYKKMPLDSGEPTEAGIAIANDSEDSHSPDTNPLRYDQPSLAVDDSGHIPTYTHGDYMLLYKKQDKYKALFESAKEDLKGGHHLAESLQDYIDKASQTNAVIEQQITEINGFLNQPQRSETAGKANAPQASQSINQPTIQE